MADETRKWRWVTSDALALVRVWPGEDKPEPIVGTIRFFSKDDCPAPVCLDEFKRLFGFCPKAGEVIKVEFSAKVIE